MSVSTTTSRVSIVGDGVTTVFTAPFKFLLNSDLAVYVNSVLQVSGYTVSGAGGNSGTVTFTSAPANLAVVTIVRAMPYTQDTVLAANGPFPAKTVETMADKGIMAVQQMIDTLGRALKFPIAETPTTDALPSLASRIGKFMGFDSSGNPVALSGTGNDSALRTDLAASTGSSLAGWLQTGAGTTARTVQSKLRDIVALADMTGFDASGVATNTAALAAAVVLMGTNGGDIYLGAGDLLFSTTAQIARDGVMLRGRSASSTRIINGSANTSAIKFGDGVSTYSRNGITDVVFAQKSGVTGLNGNCGMYAVKQSNFYCERVQAYNFPQALYQGIVLDGTSQSFFYGVGVQSCLNHGIYSKNNCLDLYFTNCRSDSNGAAGWVVEDCAGIYKVNCSAYSNTTYGFLIQSIGPNGNNFHFYTSCIADTNGNNNWEVTQMVLGAFTACWGSTQQNIAVNTSAVGFHFNGTTLSDITMNGCMAVGNNSHGIWVERAQKVTIDSPLAGSSTLTGSVNGRAGTGSGIKIGANANRVTVTSGTADGNASYGIDVDAGATKVDCCDVQLNFNTLGPVRNNANGSAAEAYFSNCRGYNPQGNAVANPAVPASTVGYVNKFGFDCDVYISAGTVTVVSLDGSFLFNSTGCTVSVPAGSTIAITYSVVPNWKWIGR
jgi:hypothetical protein